MSIQKKSLISTLKTAKKANFAGKSDAEVKGEKVASMRVPTAKNAASFKSAKANSFKSARAHTLKSAKANF